MTLSNEQLQGRCERFLNAQPHMRLLGLRVVDARPNRVTIELPVQERLYSCEVNTYLHGGVLTTMVDHASSAATLCALDAFELCPTLDLRIDHMARPRQDQPLRVDAECYRVTNSVLFTRATLYQQDRTDRPVAYAIATFMRPGAGHTDPDFKALIEGEAP